MKKKYSFLLILMILGITSISGQLKVATNGNVTIKSSSSNTPLSPLSVGNNGEQNVTATFYRTTSGYDVQTKLAGQYSSNWNYGVRSISYPKGSFFHVGVWTSATSSTANSFGRSLGLYGSAGNSTSGYNYGVLGTLAGSNRGAGVVGTINGNVDVNVPGTYAGYFVGNVRITGTVTAQNVTSSDLRLKENIVPLNNKDIKYINSVISLNPVEYNIKQVYIESVGDTALVKTKLYNEDSQQFKKKHFGLIAQELMEIYPDLVYEEEDGYLTIDYAGLIPILIQSIKELKSEIDNLRTDQLSTLSEILEERNTIQEKNTLYTSLKQPKENK